MRKTVPLEDSDEDEGSSSTLRVNEKFAKHFQEKERRKELQQAEADGLLDDDDSDSSESDEGDDAANDDTDLELAR